MPPEAGKTPIPGSDRQPLPNAHRIGPVDPNERVEVTVIVRPRSAPPPAQAADALGNLLPGERQHLSRQQLEAAAGADPADVAKIEDFARANNLDVVEVSLPRRTVRLGGTVKALSDAFSIHLEQYEVD